MTEIDLFHDAGETSFLDEDDIIDFEGLMDCQEEAGDIVAKGCLCRNTYRYCNDGCCT